jgi:hypothetical protein
MEKNILLILILSTAFSYTESAVVIYLKSLYYPNEFPFPLQTFCDTSDAPGHFRLNSKVIKEGYDAQENN